MATFTCTACNFSKPVADEMAGKKARCPKCNAVMTIPPLGESEAVSAESEAEAGNAAEDIAAATNVDEKAPRAPVASATTTQSARHEEVATEFNPVSQTWLMGLGGACLLVVAAVVLFVLQQINIGIICFAAGILVFAVMSVMFCFGPGGNS